MAENFQWSNKSTDSNVPVNRKIPFRLVAIIGIFIIAVALPATIIFSRRQQTIQQQAQVTAQWSTVISAKSVCPSSNGNIVVIQVSFKNTDWYIMTVVAKDLK